MLREILCTVRKTPISQGIQGNMQALVDMGLMTQRSTRYFEKYRANTIQRQQAVLNFVKQHKGLQELIKNDFLTIQDQMKRLNANMKGFLTGIVGKPNDPNSLYGQTVGALKSVADAFARNYPKYRTVRKRCGHSSRLGCPANRSYNGMVGQTG